MGYFSNGTEALFFDERWCSRCAHGDGNCPVMIAHELYSYELCNAKDHPGKVILDMLIPREGAHNAECRMFVEAQRGGEP